MLLLLFVVNYISPLFTLIFAVTCSSFPYSSSSSSSENVIKEKITKFEDQMRRKLCVSCPSNQPLLVILSAVARQITVGPAE